MKKILLVSMMPLLFGILWSEAQTNTFPSTGKVGIGTTSPAADLDIINTSAFGSINIGSDGNYGYQSQINFMDIDNSINGDGVGGRRVGIIEMQRVSGSAGQDGANMALYTHEANGALKQSLTLLHNGNSTFGGNVGIGVTNATNKLSIKGAIQQNWLAAFDNTETYGHKMYFGYGNNSDTNYGLLITGGRNVASYLDFAVEGKFYVMGSGNVGIGTASPSEKLSVNGKIRAREIKIETSGWSDFVFEPHYRLRSLEETERFINQNGHLPEIPTAKEVAENGINVGEMNVKLLQKIEELTLHLIEQSKELKQQGITINKLQKEINQQRSR